jgi:hypothetical protein
MTWTASISIYHWAADVLVPHIGNGNVGMLHGIHPSFALLWQYCALFMSDIFWPLRMPGIIYVCYFLTHLWFVWLLSSCEPYSELCHGPIAPNLVQELRASWRTFIWIVLIESPAGQNVIVFDSWNVSALAKRSTEWVAGNNFMNSTFSVNHVKSIPSGGTCTLKSSQIYVLVWQSALFAFNGSLWCMVQLISHAGNYIL